MKIPTGQNTANLPESIARQHHHHVAAHQSSSTVIHTTPAPIAAVWSVLRRFDSPQSYKHFIKACRVLAGDGRVGTLREVHVVSGLPAATSREILDILDDELHILSFRIVGGDNRLRNYRSVTTLHEGDSGQGTVVVESYVVDVPKGNSREETISFVNTIVKCNLQSLARTAENLCKQR